MRRRDVLAGLGAGALAASWPLEPLAATQDQVQRVEAYTRKALAKFPFKLHEVAGDKALEKWRQLKAERKGAPVVLGVDSANGSLGNLLSPFGPGSPQLRKVEQILQAAGTLTFPDDLARENKEKSAAALAQFKAMLAANPNMPLPQIVIVDKNGSRRTLNRQETIAEMEREQTDPPLGDWPVTSPKSDGPGLSVALDILTNKPLPSTSPSHRRTIGRRSLPICSGADGTLAHRQSITLPRCACGATNMVRNSSASVKTP